MMILPRVSVPILYTIPGHDIGVLLQARPYLASIPYVDVLCGIWQDESGA